MAAESYVHRVVPGVEGGPALFAFHGTGGDESQLVDLARQLLPSATVIAPRGDVLEYGAARFFKRLGEGVYDMDDLAVRTGKMARFMRAHVEARRPAKVLAIGYSNGANILASVMFSEPALVDGAVLMHPLIPFDPEIGDGFRGRRILITAGRRDPICPAPLTERLADELRGHGAELELVWHEGGHEVRPEEVAAAGRFLRGWQDGEDGDVGTS